MWKQRYLDGQPFVADPSALPIVERGRYLIEGPGHCGACHTPRDALGGEIRERRLAGATLLDAGDDPQGEDRVPNITPHEDGIGEWSEKDIAYSLESGFTPDFDTFGGSMVDVQANLAMVPSEERAAIAAYLKSIPGLPSAQD